MSGMENETENMHIKNEESSKENEINLHLSDNIDESSFILNMAKRKKDEDDGDDFDDEDDEFDDMDEDEDFDEDEDAFEDEPADEDELYEEDFDFDEDEDLLDDDEDIPYN